jgi:hypothetical protein
VKISPDEIDAVLAEHPDVAEGGGGRLSGRRAGRADLRVIVPKPGCTVTVDDLQTHFRSARTSRLQVARARAHRRAAAAQPARQGHSRRDCTQIAARP